MIDTNKPHRRRNPLTGEWTLVSPHRTQRPWQGKVEELPKTGLPEYDPNCYLCPGNSRAGGVKNPKYASTFVFENDFPALLPDTPPAVEQGPAWLERHSESGICRVICYSPRHDLTLSQLEKEEITRVVDRWVEQINDLMALPAIGYVQVFENKGEIMGCSNPHPHGQIWATRNKPNELIKEDLRQADYLTQHRKCLLCDVADYEIKAAERIVCKNEHWLALVPFWAVWPFETIVIPLRHIACLSELTSPEKETLAELWQTLLGKYDRLFQVIMPFSFGWHIAPKDAQNRDSWHLHAHFYPPLLRSATVRKFMVGYEMLGGSQRDITPELAAERLAQL